MGAFLALDILAKRPELPRSMVVWAGGFRCDGFGRMVAGALADLLCLNDSPAGIRAAIGAFLPVMFSQEFLGPMTDEALDRLADEVADSWIRDWQGTELSARYAAIKAFDMVAKCGGEAAVKKALVCPSLWLPASSDALIPTGDIINLTSGVENAVVKPVQSPLGHALVSAQPGSREHDILCRETAAFLSGIE